MSTTFEVQGFDRVVQAMNKLAFPAEFFDTVFAKNARQSVRDLVSATPKNTGRLSKGWTLPRKEGASHYVVSAKVLTHDRKHNIMTLVDQGRGWVFPIRAKRLYIPLTNKGRSKPYGAKIMSGLVFGRDYILAKKARPSKPRKFIAPVVAKLSKRLIDDMIELFNRKALGV